jgi:hypothetical protein
MKQILIAIAKSIALLAGIAMLVGGGSCSFITTFLIGFSDDTTKVYVLSGIVILLVLLFWLSIKLYTHYRNFLLLLIAGFFLAGGGICANGTFSGKDSDAWGVLLLDIALALSGYALIRWWITSEKEPPDT